MTRRPPSIAVVLGLLASCGAVLALVGLLDGSLAYRNPEVHVAIEVGAALASGLAALLAYGRSVRSRSLSDALLAGALMMLFVANGPFSLAPLLLGFDPSRFTAWAPLLVRSLAILLFLAAVFADGRLMARPRRRAAQVLLGGAGLALLLAAGVSILGERLPSLVEVGRGPETGTPVLDAAPGLLVIQLLMAVASFVAAVGFGRQYQQRHDELRLWVSGGLTLAGLSQLSNAAAPTLYTEYVSVSDLLRLAFYGMLLAGAVREIASYQRGLSEAAVLGERRRLARDLHDGLAQELAYLTGQARSLRRHVDDPERVDGIVSSAERALAESRFAISALHQPLDGPLSAALAAAATDAGRGQLVVDFDVEHHHDLEVEAREALVRIVAEAAGNAVRHGGAERMRITLDGAKGLLLRLEDDGRGFDPAAQVRTGAYGLRGMRERAQDLGGELRVESAPDRGTVVEVRLP